MFGVVPKKIWGRLLPSDENNLIPMETNLFVLRAGGKNILLDAGFGDCLTPTEEKIYAVSGETGIEAGLENIGLTPNDIHINFLTHLHTDHAGGVVACSDGKYVPRFKNAVYMVQKKEWEDAMNPDERTAAVYIPDRLKTLQTAGQIELLEGDHEIMPGVRAVHTGGHTAGHQAIEATSGETTVVYYADIVPSSHHIKVPYVAAVDIYPRETMAVKRKLLKRLINDDMAIVFDHDIEIKIGRVSENDIGKILVDKVE